MISSCPRTLSNSSRQQFVRHICPWDFIQGIVSSKYVQEICPNNMSKKYVYRNLSTGLSAKYVQKLCPYEFTHGIVRELCPKIVFRDISPNNYTPRHAPGVLLSGGFVPEQIPKNYIQNNFNKNDARLFFPLRNMFKGN